MGRRPKQESVKEFLHNKKTRFLFSDAAEYANIFPEGKTEMYLKPVPAGGRMKKGHFQIIGHFPNSESNNREAFVQQKEQGSLGRFMKGAMKAKRYRWDAGSYSGFHLILHDQRGKRQEFMLRSLGDKRKGALVFAQMAVPSEKDRRLFVCPVNVGFFGPSASRSGEFKLTMAKPKAECTPGLVKDGHAPAAYEKVYKSKKKTVKAAETLDEEGFGYFYESQGYSYDAETYEAETATYEPSNEPDMASPATEPTNANFEAEKVRMCASCGSYKNAEGHDCGCMGAEEVNWKELTREEREQILHDAGYPEVKDAESQDATYEPSQEPDMESPATEPTNANFEAQGAYPSLEDFTGTESVVVEPPLGHGVAQWYAETATYEPSSEPDMESPATEPTNANFESESSPSSFDITWEDAQGVSSPSLPPEGIHFAESQEFTFVYSVYDKETGDFIEDNEVLIYASNETEARQKAMRMLEEGGLDDEEFHIHNAETEEAFGSVGEGNNFGQMRAEHESDFVVEKPFTTGAKLSAGWLTGVTLFAVAGALATGLLGKFMDKEE